jgi:hypothetical protein
VGFAADVVVTGGKLVIGVVDTGGTSFRRCALTTGVVDIGRKLATGFVDAIGKSLLIIRIFATGINDSSSK